MYWEVVGTVLLCFRVMKRRCDSPPFFVIIPKGLGAVLKVACGYFPSAWAKGRGVGKQAVKECYEWELDKITQKDCMKWN
jgi:hypothetical protein